MFISYETAARMFQESTELAQVTQSSQNSWASVYMNLGTCYRKLGLVFLLDFCGGDQLNKSRLHWQTTGGSQRGIQQSAPDRPAQRDGPRIPRDHAPSDGRD
jgi:hypothetical protein